jgi:hypothetical protein
MLRAGALVGPHARAPHQPKTDALPLQLQAKSLAAEVGSWSGWLPDGAAARSAAASVSDYIPAWSAVPGFASGPSFSEPAPARREDDLL